MADGSEHFSSSTPRLRGGDVRVQEFPSARRGLDPAAVRRYLEEVAGALDQLHGRVEQLNTALEAAKARPPTPELDEAALAAALGSETGRVLQVAHEAARELVAKAEARAQALVAEADAALAEKRHAAEAEAFQISAKARAEAENVLQAAKQQCQQMLDEARHARRSILSDLAERRRVLHVQLEQLRAGKDALSEVVETVAQSIDDVRARLANSEDHARAVAADAAQYAVADFELVLPDATTPAEDLAVRVLEPSMPASAPLTPPAPAAAASSEAADSAVASTVAPTPAVAPHESQGLDDQAMTEGEGQAAAVDQQALDAAGKASPGHEERIGALFDALRESAPGEEHNVSAPAPNELVEVHATGLEQAGESDAAREDEAVASEEETLLQRRATLLDEPTAALGRALKKAMRLEQNEILDALRQLPKNGEPLSLLPGDATRTRFVGALLTPLADCLHAGRAFSAGLLDQAPLPEDHEATPAAESVAAEMADALVEALGRRMEPGLQDLDDTSETASAIALAFRDWKGARADSVAADFGVQAFSIGVLDVARDVGAKLSWIVLDDEPRCPDCEDDSLATGLMAGEEFPTGHLHPPVHAGCRCLIVPSRA